MVTIFDEEKKKYVKLPSKSDASAYSKRRRYARDPRERYRRYYDDESASSGEEQDSGDSDSGESDQESIGGHSRGDSESEGSDCSSDGASEVSSVGGDVRSGSKRKNGSRGDRLGEGPKPRAVQEEKVEQLVIMMQALVNTLVREHWLSKCEKQLYDKVKDCPLCFIVKE